MAGTLRAGDRVHRHNDRTQPAGVIECCRWWQGEPSYKVRWPHGTCTVHTAQELIHAKRVRSERARLSQPNRLEREHPPGVARRGVTHGEAPAPSRGLVPTPRRNP